MTPWLTLLVLLVTHAGAAFGGGVIAHALIVRRLRVTERDGHLALEVAPCQTDDPKGPPDAV